MILPGQTVGILGGGQLGRMLAIAARRMGYGVWVFSPTAHGPASQVADAEIVAPFDDLDAARRFAAGVDVATIEFENVSTETLRVIGQSHPVHPSPEVLDICRHRIREKDFLSRHGFPVTRYRQVRDGAELVAAVAQIGTPAILKSADYGYDGKGQVRIDQPDEAPEAWEAMGGPVGVLEALVPFVRELSVICACGADGQVIAFPAAENVHVRHILDVTTVPADLTPSTARQAVKLASAIAKTLGVVGLLAVEMFELQSGELLVNELAPRPHNSGHFSIDACVTDQFEQQLRAVCGLRLGSVELLRPAAMANLLGDLWERAEPNWAAALSYPEVKLHLYGKAEARPRRKMGHLTALAETPAQAREMVIAARNSLVL